MSPEPRLWVYQLRVLIWTDLDLIDQNRLMFVKTSLKADDTPRRQRTALFSNLYSDYPGVFLTTEGDEGVLDMECLEGENVDTWMRDFASAEELPNVGRMCSPVRGRIKTIGTLYQAYLPIPNLFEAIKRKTLEFKSVDDWESVLRLRRPRHGL